MVITMLITDLLSANQRLPNQYGHTRQVVGARVCFNPPWVLAQVINIGTIGNDSGVGIGECANLDDSG
eukprot:6974679-Karenia_brevis.AAC.1